MLSRWKPRRSGVTFDVGAAGVRACQLRGRTGTPQLEDVLEIDRMPTVLTGKPAAPSVDSTLLGRLVGQGRFTGREVTLILSPPEVQFFPLRIPEPALAQSPERIEQALRWEVAQESRLAAEALEVRHWRLPPGVGECANVMAVVLASATADAWCAQLAAERLVLHRIDVSPCALVRLVRRAWTPGESELWGVLDLGLRHSTLTLVLGTVPVYVRSLSVNAHDWTRQLAGAFEVAPSTAEQLKCAHGVQHTPRGHQATTAERNLLNATDLSSAVASVLRDSLRTLGQEVGRCFSYMMQSFPEATVGRLLLAGGGANLPGLGDLLSRDLELNVSRLADESRDAAAWEAPLADAAVQCRLAAAVGGAMLDWESA